MMDVDRGNRIAKGSSRAIKVIKRGPRYAGRRFEIDDSAGCSI